MDFLMILVYIAIVFFLVFPLCTGIYSGCLRRIYVLPSSFGYYPKDILYKEFMGSFASAREQFAKMREDAQNYFTFLHDIAIFYDDPEKLKDPGQCRSIVGFEVFLNSEKPKIPSFLKNFKSYKRTQLPYVQALVADFPYVKLFSALSMNLGDRKVYPVLKKVVEKKKKDLEIYKVGPYLEFYEYRSKTIRYFVLYGDGIENYFLNKLPSPALKAIKA